jgi:hypothetical protein
MTVRDVAVIVQENPVHIVEVRTGVQGKRGPQGIPGPIGPQGLIGPPGKEVSTIQTPAALINITADNHADYYVTTNIDDAYVLVVLGSTDIIENGETVLGDHAVVFFTQLSETLISFQTIDENITLIVPVGKNAATFGQGSSVGVKVVTENTWVLFGDLAPKDLVEE